MCVNFLTGPRLNRRMTTVVLTCDAQTLNRVRLNVESKRHVGAIGNLLDRAWAHGI